MQLRKLKASGWPVDRVLDPLGHHREIGRQIRWATVSDLYWQARFSVSE